MKKLITATLIAFAACGAFAEIENGELRMENAATLNSQLSTLNSSIDDLSALADTLAELSLKYDALTNMIAFIERKCETDPSWRKAYHQGVAAQAPITNEYGIVYSVTVYNDGYTYADYKTTARKALTKAEEETRQKEVIERKRLECIEAMRKATLPPVVMKMLEQLKADEKRIEN